MTRMRRIVGERGMNDITMMKPHVIETSSSNLTWDPQILKTDDLPC